MANRATYVFFVLVENINLFFYNLIFIIEKKNRKKKYKALKLRLISPESPLTIFSTLYKNVPIELIEKSYNNYTVFSASIEVRINLI